MESKKLSSEYNIPYIGLGTWQLTGQDCIDAVTYALSTGYRHIDTASMYRNEKEIGTAIKQSNVDRDEIYVTSKVWRTDLGTQPTMKSFHDSLENLQTDYLDLYLIHWPGNNRDNRIESFGVMRELRDNNKIRSIGVSNFTPSQIEDIYETFGEYPAVNQIHFNPFHYNRENLNYCNDKGIALTAYTPLNKGRGLDDPKVTDLAEKYNKSIVQIILRWYIDQGIITIPKSATPKHIKSNFDVFDFSLTQEEVKSLINL